MIFVYSKTALWYHGGSSTRSRWIQNYWEVKMSYKIAREYLEKKGLAGKIMLHKDTIDTVEHAAMQIGCSEAEIAKTLSFLVEEKPVVVVMAGDGKVNSSKFKKVFHEKPHMIPREAVNEMIGHEPGGVCPFGVKAGVPIWLDVSMKRFDVVHPAGGDEFTSVALTPQELERSIDNAKWCDICTGWEEN